MAQRSPILPLFSGGKHTVNNFFILLQFLTIKSVENGTED